MNILNLLSSLYIFYIIYIISIKSLPYQTNDIQYTKNNKYRKDLYVKQYHETQTNAS